MGPALDGIHSQAAAANNVHDRHRCPQEGALTTAQVGPPRVGCKRSALSDNRGPFDDKGRQNRKNCATAGVRGL